MATNENLIPIPGRLHSVATEGHVAGADEIIDDNLSKDQQTINAEVNAALGEGGTVDEKIAEAIDDALENVAFIDDSESSPAVVPGFDPTTDTVHVTAQTLSESQKAQVRTNIGLNDVDAKINQAVASEASQRAAAVSSVQSSVSAETSRAQAKEALLQNNIEALTQSNIVIVANHTSISSPDPLTIYREQGTNTYSDWMYQNDSWNKMAEYDNAIDDEPTAGSNNLVKSRSVYNLETLIGKVTIFEETTSGNSQKKFRYDFKKGVKYKLLNLGDYLPQSVFLSSSYEDAENTRIQTINTNYILANESIEFTCNVDNAVCINAWLPAHTEFSLEEVNSLNNRIQKNTDDIAELKPKVAALEENKKETDAVSADGFNGATYSGTSPEISAYYGAWCYVKPIYIKKGTKAIITVSNADSAIRGDSALTIVRPDNTYFDTNVIFKQNVPTEYIFEDDAVSVGRYATLTVTGTFSISIQVIPFAERINILENNLDYKYPPYPIWGHEYMQAWYKKMYLASGSTTFKIVCAGDSTTLNGNRDVYVKRLMVFRNWNENNINCVNMGVNGAQTESWIGSSESTPQYGYLDAQMAENPDLIVLGYGLNDGSNIQYPSLTWEERAANFESRLREGLGRIRTNGTFTSGPSYNKSASELAIIITTPVSISPDNNSGNTNTADNWCKLIDPIIKKACRDFQCAYANFTTREYDHTWNKAWSISNDGIHPDSFIQKEMVSLLSDLVCPLLYTFS